MKKPSISIFIIALVMLSNWLLPDGLHAQEIKMIPAEEKTDSAFFQGIHVGVDVFGFLSQAFGSDATTTEVSVEANLMNRFFPVLEIGYGSMDTTNDETDIHYKTSAPFFRVGVNYNVFYKKPHLPGYFTVGLRYGHSSFKYDIQSPDLVDPNWGHTSVPFDYQGVKTSVGWMELVVGLRANVFQNFYMGFTARYRSRLSMKENENSEPYYIPGYGRGKSTNLGITYNLIYKLPF